MPIEYQYHFEKQFYLDKSTGYYISSNCPKIRAHVFVWKKFNGDIPKKHHIHHKDGDKSNNSIENLEMMSASDHTRLHMKLIMQDPQKKQKALDNCAKIRLLTKEWHASEEGHNWHKQHAANFNFGKHEPVDYTCEQCSKVFSSRKVSGARFCSNNCKSCNRRASKVDHIEKQCPICNVKFSINKYSLTKTCGKSCGKILQNRKY